MATQPLLPLQNVAAPTALALALFQILLRTT